MLSYILSLCTLSNIGHKTGRKLNLRDVLPPGYSDDNVDKATDSQLLATAQNFVAEYNGIKADARKVLRGSSGYSEGTIKSYLNKNRKLTLKFRKRIVEFLKERHNLMVSAFTVCLHVCCFI